MQMKNFGAMPVFC